MSSRGSASESGRSCGPNRTLGREIRHIDCGSTLGNQCRLSRPRRSPTATASTRWSAARSSWSPASNPYVSVASGRCARARRRLRRRCRAVGSGRTRHAGQPRWRDECCDYRTTAQILSAGSTVHGVVVHAIDAPDSTSTPDDWRSQHSGERRDSAESGARACQCSARSVTPSRSSQRQIRWASSAACTESATCGDSAVGSSAATSGSGVRAFQDAARRPWRTTTPSPSASSAHSVPRPAGTATPVVERATARGLGIGLLPRPLPRTADRRQAGPCDREGVRAPRRGLARHHLGGAGPPCRRPSSSTDPSQGHRAVPSCPNEHWAARCCRRCCSAGWERRPRSRGQRARLPCENGTVRGRAPSSSRTVRTIERRGKRSSVNLIHV